MKKILLLFLLWPTVIFSQCSIDDIIVFQHGISKFDAIKQSKSVKGFRESKRNAESVASWQKFEYLEDSIYKDAFYFEVSNIQCYKWNSCYYSIFFADDYLYKQIIRIEVDTVDFNDYIEIYNKMVQLFRLEFAFSKSIEIRDPITNIKEGEGFVLTDIDGFQEKTDEVRVYKTISYKYDVASNVTTNEIDKYVITIESTDLKGTRMDSRGY